MVTLLGFFFILTNVICLELFMPDLVGPVRGLVWVLICGVLIDSSRDRHGFITALLSDYGCIRQWTMWMASRREEQEHLAV